tara:strand:- start:1846 stop:2235 length:390 start_codon:yes stop_codon:yes gene_type:complete
MSKKGNSLNSNCKSKNIPFFTEINIFMSAKLSRGGDKTTTGHECTKIVGCISTQRSVFANSRPVLRQGDPTKGHTILSPDDPPRCIGHKAKVNRGSSSVFVESIPVARVGDSADFGALISGSFTVRAGG